MTSMETFSLAFKAGHRPIWLSRQPRPSPPGAVTTQPVQARRRTAVQQWRPQQQHLQHSVMEPSNDDTPDTKELDTVGASKHHMQHARVQHPRRSSGSPEGSSSTGSKDSGGHRSDDRHNTGGRDGKHSNVSSRNARHSNARHSNAGGSNGSSSSSSSNSSDRPRILYIPMRLDKLAAKYFPTSPTAAPPTTPPTHMHSPPLRPSTSQAKGAQQPRDDANTATLAASAALTPMQQQVPAAATTVSGGMQKSSTLTSSAPATGGADKSAASQLSTTAVDAPNDAPNTAADHDASALRRASNQQASSTADPAYSLGLSMVPTAVATRSKRRRQRVQVRPQAAFGPLDAASVGDDAVDGCCASMLQLNGPAPARLSLQMEQLLCRALQEFEVLKELKPVRHRAAKERKSEVKQWAAATGMSVEDLQTRVRTGQMATQVLPAAYAGLIVNMAQRMATADISMDDLIAEGREGLLQAALQYRPDSGARLATYAQWHVGKHMQQLFVKFGGAGHMHVPRGLADLCTPVMRAHDTLSQQLGRSPSHDEIAAELGSSADRVAQVLQLTRRRGINLDAPLTDDDGDGATTALDQLSSVEDEADAQPGTSQGTGVMHNAAAVAAGTSLACEMERLLSRLNARDAAAVRMRLGLGPGGAVAAHGHEDTVRHVVPGVDVAQGKGMTSREVAEVLGVTRQRSEQLVARGLAQLKFALAEEAEGSRELEALLAASGVTVRRRRK